MSNKQSLLLHLEQLIERGHEEATFNVQYLYKALNDNDTGTVEVTYNDYDSGQFNQEQ